jgi:hypothetical protein
MLMNFIDHNCFPFNIFQDSNILDQKFVTGDKNIKFNLSLMRVLVCFGGRIPSF